MFSLGVNHITTTPYYPQGSLAERVNRNLKSTLKIFYHRSQNTWDEDLRGYVLRLILRRMRVLRPSQICYFLLRKVGLLLCPDGIYLRRMTVNLRQDSHSGHRRTIP